MNAFLVVVAIAAVVAYVWHSRREGEKPTRPAAKIVVSGAEESRPPASPPLPPRDAEGQPRLRRPPSPRRPPPPPPAPAHARTASFSQISPSPSLSPSVFCLAAAEAGAESVPGSPVLLPTLPEDGGAAAAAAVAAAAEAAAELTHRERVLNEVVESERKYAFFLSELASKYAAPMAKLIGADECDRVFSNVRSLADFHRVLLRDLEEAGGRVGPVFRRHSPFLKLYISYVSNYDEALEAVERATRKKKVLSFLDATRRANSRQHNGLGLVGLLIMPVQRIPRYRMLLEDVIKHTEDGSDELPELRAALALVAEIADTVNERKRRAEMQSDLLVIQSRMRGTASSVKLIQPHRHLVRRGELLMRRGASRKAYKVFLFNDALLLTSATSGRFKGFAELGRALAARDDAAPDPRLGFLVMNGPEQWTFECGSARERDVWLSAVETSCAWARDHEKQQTVTQ